MDLPFAGSLSSTDGESNEEVGRSEEDREFFSGDDFEYEQTGTSEDDTSSSGSEQEDVVASLLALPNPPQHSSMQLTSQEKSWSLAIKHFVEKESEELCPLADMEYAVYAIISHGNLADAMRRIQGIQAFREAYRVDVSPQQGVHMIEEFLNQQPRAMLYIDVDVETLQGINVWNAGALDFNKALATEATWRTYIVGAYYMYYACQPTLQTVRQGHAVMADFTAFSWDTKHINEEYHSRYAGEMFSFFPVRFAKYLAFNTGFPATVAWTMLKRVFPPSLIQVIQLGCEIPMAEGEQVPSTLEEKYLQPSLQEANNRTLCRALDLLSLRAKNQALFQL
ncbi:expressed unknown protein [Seminavis robusta]|uniref:Uncharacterized protein n=1 Tax=Seminavis robusta TaxID=568900 RepID=A0A9N8DTI6_9STRA|nr:expressed unknown protein [Seminavis robusta]|eukprot:Sro331_g119140.1 n/a (337) ;mRNA; f:41491-42501